MGVTEQKDVHTRIPGICGHVSLFITEKRTIVALFLTKKAIPTFLPGSMHRNGRLLVLNLVSPRYRIKCKEILKPQN